ncbi:hypothetical protein CR513_24103, partial [Mucuna pruriens]
MDVEFPMIVAAIFKPVGVTKCVFNIVWYPFGEFILPLNMAEAVRYRPSQGSTENNKFLGSHICCMSSGTLRALYCREPRDVKGANPTMKKWRLGKGMRFTASFRILVFSGPGNLRLQLEGAEANVVQGFIIKHHALVCVFNKLVNGERSIVGFHNSVGNLGGRKN